MSSDVGKSMQQQARLYTSAALALKLALPRTFWGANSHPMSALNVHPCTLLHSISDVADVLALRGGHVRGHLKVELTPYNYL